MTHRIFITWLIAGLIMGLHTHSAAGATTAGDAPRVVTVHAQVETPPVASDDDAADDAAVWVDARQPERSVIIATDKRAGLYVYDLQGKQLQALPDGRMNNVDVRDGFSLGDDKITVAAATNRTNDSIALYRLDPGTRQLTSIADGVLASGLNDLYGLCMYRSKAGPFYVIANNEHGKVRQWKLVGRNGRVALELAREITVGSQAEGCVADDESGRLYIAEEDVGLWRYSAEPQGGDARTQIDRVGAGNLVADVEGLAIYDTGGGNGFLVASSQGENAFALYRREGANDYLGKFSIAADDHSGIDGVSDTDGLDVTSAPLGAQFPNGLLVVQDGENESPPANQNFKYVSWREVATALKLR